MKEQVSSGDIDFDALSNKEMIEIMASAFDNAVDARTKLAVDEANKNNQAIVDKVAGIEKYLIQREAASGVEAARAKFNDFDNYREDMSKLFEMYPGITPEDAYILAKSKKSSDAPPQKEVETEKPDNFGTRAQEESVTRERRTEEKKINSRRDFRQFINDAAARVIDENRR